MEPGLLLGCVIVLLIIWLLRVKYVKYGGAGQAAKELRLLTSSQREGSSTPEDLPRWEDSQRRMENYLSEYNKLNMEIRFTEAFLFYLEQHYPADPRVGILQESAAHRKDSIWGFKVNR
ncbi:hypothetical protein FHS18_005996 [Paenibacillus phyllosphaerae]|uniref:Uncharacterized protein n=1 Tax=Paenibacillus phyllosphaerae TaxID=274593 RepID=A0A7W5B4P8_9BACL|nr:hypothetical protein [Paenibacillus phyllosphaerae]MBB3113881.1 hypothetical protein [Paenibacillus phyllosphaerae]